jgi:hypothetical protein
MVRRTASVHPVHSAKCSHKTGGLLGDVKAAATSRAAADPIPIAAATAEQNLMKSRRVIPFTPALILSLSIVSPF